MRIIKPEPIRSRICRWCGGMVNADEPCPPCAKSFPLRAAPHTMTPDQRESEMRLLKWCEVPFEKVHARIERLVGRPVWTHEMGAGFESLCLEARWDGPPATMAQVIDKLPSGKTVITVEHS